MNRAEISILIVEDEDILRSLYAKVLESYTTHTAKNGEEGLKLFLEYRPDIVITDIKMPIMNGLQMIERIKRETPEARIVLISASNESRHFLEAIELGVKGYLLKPFDNDEFRKTIDEISSDIFLSRKIKQAEIEIATNQKTLKTINEISELLMRKGYNEKTIYTSLEMLGNVLQVSRIHIYENQNDNYKYIKEWTAPNIKSIKNNPIFNSFIQTGFPLPKFSEININESSFWSDTELFPETISNYLKNTDTKTILIIKISVKDQWQGFIGFDSCIEKRNWLESERTILETVGKIIGSAIYRSQIENELKDLTINLENKIKQRTQELDNLNSKLETKIQEGIKHIKEQDMLLSVKAKTESLGELHAYIAHELNQPITGLSLSLENMLFHLADKQNDVDYIRKKSNLMFQDIERMRVITNDILNFSRKDGNEEDQPIELAKIIENSISFYKGFFSKHNITLHSEIIPGNYFSIGKSLQLELVLLNLLRNAHHAIEQKAIKTDRYFEKKVIISLTQEDDKNIIEVHDNGVGIPKKNLEKIFEMLFTTQTKSKGTGLGLALSKMFIEDMNGKLTVESIENEYTKMKITLPSIEKS